MNARAWAAAGLALLTTAGAALAQGLPQDAFDTRASNLIAVLRESAGVNQSEEVLQPYGTLRAQLPDGSEVELETSWFRYVGDMHIRLVFDSSTQLQSASPEDLDRLRLEPEQAVQLAVSNLRRVYGEPTTRPWQAGLTQVLGRADDLNSSYMLDRPFWQGLEARHPGGLVVAVPQRGGLLYAPARDPDAVAALRFSAAAIYAAASRMRVSSALYLFRDGHWSVFQPPVH
ncbi:MAG TPA: hypothetical protein VFE82_12670 [Ramlibacter sp.]|jgi:hypothetical protein|uniref:hypothetical protein n=1 Tax=Ramlibacter sp. TaxID=1917967 RepID=UPI002D67A7E8|nr:hypothetical protein [Ramlibacter sp.]HZY19327.1 hypothetical protein [Ramlibacter sp.]